LLEAGRHPRATVSARLHAPRTDGAGRDASVLRSRDAQS
jgi:hypothetical protein